MVTFEDRHVRSSSSVLSPHQVHTEHDAHHAEDEGNPVSDAVSARRPRSVIGYAAPLIVHRQLRRHHTLTQA